MKFWGVGQLSEPHSYTAQKCLLRKKGKKEQRKEGGGGNGRKFSVAFSSELMFSLCPTVFSPHWSKVTKNTRFIEQKENRHLNMYGLQSLADSFFCKVFPFSCLCYQFNSLFDICYLEMDWISSMPKKNLSHECYTSQPLYCLLYVEIVRKESRNPLFSSWKYTFFKLPTLSFNYFFKKIKKKKLKRKIEMPRFYPNILLLY